MRILFINLIGSTAENGVITTYKSNSDSIGYCMARGFTNLGHEVTLAIAEDFRPSEPESNPFEIIYFKSRFKRLFKPALLPWPKGLAKFIKTNRDRFDLIISTEIFAISSLLASRYKPESTVVLQELSLLQKKFFGIPARVWYNGVAKLMRKVLVIPMSQRAHDFVAKYMPRVSTDFIFHGVDADKFQPSDKIVNSFVVIARLVPGKQIDKLIDRFSNFVKIPEYANYQLHIIGDGPEREKLTQQISSLNLTHNVTMHGYLTHKELSVISNKAKGLLIDTVKDMNMISVAESIASGTPVIMNTVSNLWKFINDNNLGIGKDDWDHNDLVKMVENYDLFHQNCISIRDRLTNTGTAQSIIDIHTKYNLS